MALVCVFAFVLLWISFFESTSKAPPCPLMLLWCAQERSFVDTEKSQERSLRRMYRFSRCDGANISPL